MCVCVCVSGCVQAFLVCLHQWSQCNEEETDGDSGSFQPDLLPMALSPNKITEQQLAWWCDVLDFSRTRYCSFCALFIAMVQQPWNAQCCSVVRIAVVYSLATWVTINTLGTL